MARILFVEDNLRVDKLGVYLSDILKVKRHETDLIQASMFSP
jgi:hypothetical protein